MKKLLSTTIAVGLFTSLSMTPVLADVSANALPVINNKTNAEITTQNSKMNIQIQGGKGGVGTLNWKEYNIGKDAHVNYEFSAHNQTAVNKVAASGGLSQIYGKITDSGCLNCGYEGSGKIILLNPNGVLFGNGANVDVNSFTVSTMDGVFDNKKNTLKLLKGADQKDAGIMVENGAKIYGDKNVAFASNNITLYTGSKLSTNIGKNVGDEAYGKVKLVTADGVNFEYYNNGAVKSIPNESLVASKDKMFLSINGDINSGHIDARNWSTYDNGKDDCSAINLNGATLKATKLVQANDGNIWLTSLNRVVSEDSNYDAGGEVRIMAGNKISSKNDTIKAADGINVQSINGDVAFGSKATTPKDIVIKAGKIASVQRGANLNADNIIIEGGDVTLTDSTVKAKSKITATATGNTGDGDVFVSNEKLDAPEIDLTAAHDIFGDADVNNNLLKLNAGNDIDVQLLNIGNREKGLVAEAGKNISIETPDTLSVSSIISKDGDVTLTAENVIAGLPYTDNEKIPGDDSPRSYIYVKNGTFTSNTPNDPFKVTASDTITADGKHKERHHIQYGNGEEKILLINDRPFEPEPVPPGPDPDPDPVPPGPDPDPDPQPDPDVDEGQTSMLNRIPRQPEVFKINNNIADGRTMLVDVYAAASQIEIEDDEEE